VGSVISLLLRSVSIFSYLLTMSSDRPAECFGGNYDLSSSIRKDGEEVLPRLLGSLLIKCGEQPWCELSLNECRLNGDPGMSFRTS
jgi:hypothetical protein